MVMEVSILTEYFVGQRKYTYSLDFSSSILGIFQEIPWVGGHRSPLPSGGDEVVAGLLEPRQRPIGACSVLGFPALYSPVDICRVSEQGATIAADILGMRSLSRSTVI
jgi:hypothetical protein